MGGSGSHSDLQQLYSRLRLLGGLLYSSSEFRKLITDLSVVARDIFADAASNVASVAGSAAEQIHPSEEQLAQLDSSAPETFASREEGAKASKDFPAESSKLQKQASEKSKDVAADARRKAYKAGDDVQEYLKQKFPKQRRDAVINRMKKIIRDIQGNEEFQEAAEFVLTLVRDYAAKLRDATAGETKKSSEMSYNTHFQAAMDKVKEILTVFANGKSPDHVKQALNQVVEDINSDDDLNAFYRDVTGFLQHMLAEPTFTISDAADSEAHELFDRSKALLEQKKDTYRPHVEKLFDELHEFLTAIQKDKANVRVSEASKRVFNDLVISPTGKNAAATTSGFGFTDSPFTRLPYGYRLRKKVVRDLIDIILPQCIAELKYIPVPRIEYQDMDYDLILENVVLESENFVPERLLFEAHTRAEYTEDPYVVMKAHYSGYTRVRVQKLRFSVHDLAFVVRKKTGLIPFRDKGRGDIEVECTVDVVLDSARGLLDSDDSEEGTDPSPNNAWEDDDEHDSYFHVRSVHATLTKFDYNYYDAYHTWAAALLAPFIRSAVKNVVGRMLEEKIYDAVGWADREIYALGERMRVASIASDGNVEGWVRAVLSRSKGRRGGQMGARGGRGGRDGRGGWVVTVGTEDEEGLFPGEHAPGAVVSEFLGGGRTRAGAGRGGGGGDGWRSDVFNLYY
ncbi:hypothetical protein DFH27DRAFT_482855 [Peziza echinospora]|nr:hypothetical protein DFH27DRAFT_482855 [Peziza echinospora]